MKNNLSLLIGASLLATVVGSFAQTAVTDPVGYITINVAGNGGSAAGKYSAIAPTLVNKVEYSGVVTAISGDGLTLTVAGLAENAFANGFWIEVTNGSGEGAWTNIASNTATSIVVADDMRPFITAGTSTIKVRQHVTVNQFFGATNTAGLLEGGDAGAADEVTFVGDRGVAALNETVFFDGAAWSDVFFAAAGSKVIEPGRGLLVLRKAPTAVSFVQVGHVKTGKSMTSVLGGPSAADAGENVVGIRSAVGTTLVNSKLHTGNTTTGVAEGGDAGSADEVFQFVGGVPNGYFHDGANWNDSFFANADNVNLPEGSAVYIVRKSTQDFVWTSDAVTISTTP